MVAESWAGLELLALLQHPSPSLLFYPPLPSLWSLVRWSQVVGLFVLWLKSTCSREQGRSYVVFVTYSLQPHGVTYAGLSWASTPQAPLVSRGHRPTYQWKERERICTHFKTKVQAVRMKSRMGPRWPEGLVTPIINQLTLNPPLRAFLWHTGLPYPQCP